MSIYERLFGDFSGLVILCAQEYSNDCIFLIKNKGITIVFRRRFWRSETVLQIQQVSQSLLHCWAYNAALVSHTWCLFRGFYCYNLNDNCDVNIAYYVTCRKQSRTCYLRCQALLQFSQPTVILYNALLGRRAVRRWRSGGKRAWWYNKGLIWISVRCRVTVSRRAPIPFDFGIASIALLRLATYFSLENISRIFVYSSNSVVGFFTMSLCCSFMCVLLHSISTFNIVKNSHAMALYGGEGKERCDTQIYSDVIAV